MTLTHDVMNKRQFRLPSEPAGTRRKTSTVPLPDWGPHCPRLAQTPGPPVWPPRSLSGRLGPWTHKRYFVLYIDVHFITAMSLLYQNVLNVNALMYELLRTKQYFPHVICFTWNTDHRNEHNVFVTRRRTCIDQDRPRGQRLDLWRNRSWQFLHGSLSNHDHRNHDGPTKNNWNTAKSVIVAPTAIFTHD